MAVLFAGHEANSFAEFNAGDVITYAGSATVIRFDPDFSRAALYSAGSAAARNRGAKIVIPATAEGWVGFRYNVGVNASSGVLLAAYTADDVSTLFDLNGSTGLTLRGATSDTARTNISPASSGASGVPAFINVHWKAVTGGMLLELFKDGALISTATISNAYLNGKSVGIIRIGGSALGSPANANSNYGYSYSEIVVSDEDNRGWRIATLVPNAPGSLSQWDGSFADIDEADADDADYISSDVADEVSLFGMSNLSVAAQNMDVKALSFSARARKGTTGPLNIQAALRSGGTNFFTANLAGLNTGFGALQTTTWHNNPITSAPFTVSEIQGIELGFKSAT